MTKQQQEFYDKLLKKVNEYCLGAAAEDVIEAIDNLVDNYEDQLDIRYVFMGSRACGKSEELIRRARVINKLQALEIIYKKRVDMQWLAIQFDGADMEKLIRYLKEFPNMGSLEPLTPEEIKLLKETYDEK